MKIILGSDHGGFLLKEHLKKFLENKNHELEDIGCHSEESVDYPEFGKKVAQKCVAQECLGVIICGTGIGISIAANKVDGARAAVCTNTTMASFSRKHNNAQILALGGRIVGTLLAEEIVEVFLNTEFEGGRHERRVNQINF